jgi:hypothetical protein
MVALFLRVVFGFVLACLAVAATKVAFVITPADVLSLEPDARLERLARAGVLTLAVATQTGIFAAPFAVIVIGYAYWQRIKGWPYFVFSGLIISLLGLAVLFAAESPAKPTIANAYAIAAYIFAGMIGGYVYWIAAGRKAGRGGPQPKRDFNALPGSAAAGDAKGGRSTSGDEDVKVKKAARNGNGSGIAQGT